MAWTTNNLNGGGTTIHYQFQYDDSLAQSPTNPTGPEPARTNAVIAAAETDFGQMANWFGNIGLNVNFPIAVNVSQNGGGANWGLSSGNLTITINPAAENANQVRYHLVMEMTEQFMRAQGGGWYGSSTEGSAGEGLSRFLATQFMINNGLGAQPAGFDNSNSWLSTARADFVNNLNLTDDGPDAITGCALCFIYYLFAQLGFTRDQIVGAGVGAKTLGDVYRNLTGDMVDPFLFFKRLVDTALPGTATVTSGNLDNPFPIGVLSFWVDKSTFGRDEVADVIGSPTHGAFNNAFWVMLEGFNIQGFNALGVASPILTGPFANLSQIGLAPNAAGVEFEDSTNLRLPQRIRFPFDVIFTSGTLNAFPASGGAPILEVLNVEVNGSGGPLPGATATTEFELVGGADPYFTNIDPAQNNVFWLSQDLRVFTATPGLNANPVLSAPSFNNDSNGGAYSYIQSLLGWLNDPNNHFTDGTDDPFASGVIPQQGAALTGDSSVTPFTLDISNIFNIRFLNNYNFAIARVRLRGALGSSAQSVKAFFRMWSTQSADTDFLPGSTYLSNQMGGRPSSPLAAPDAHTFPFFATSNQPNLGDPNNPEYGVNGLNNRTVTITSGDQAFAYFGCFLNVYDAGNLVNGMPVQMLLTGTHHCLVAEIAYDEAPILNANGLTASPESSDKLAQRNLVVTHSDNPGPAETHRIPQTFDLRPSPALMASAGQLLDYPDELMIDWGLTPVGSKAHIYWPQVSANQVLSLAGRLYGSHFLSASDANTIDCTITRGVTYIPIPLGVSENFAGLFTVDLPTTVTTGQEFNIVVRRVASRRVPGDIQRLRIEQTHDTVRRLAVDRDAPRQELPAMRNWRYVVGTFQVKIPVTTSAVMLWPEENTLAIMKWRFGQMKPGNRWRPVLERYIGYLSARVDELGGNASSVEPSPNGVTAVPGRDRENLQTFAGRVEEVLFDCFGRFEGFVLMGCSERQAFKSCEPDVRDLVLRACRERFTIKVFIAPKSERIARLIVTCC